jgi:8-oxo-dGTP pyrophosphatase MutT (NUDIX family)
MDCFSLVVCRHPATKRWLAVNETEHRGWWLPGGFVECGDDHFTAAVRETLEEAGIDVILKGVLRVENSMGDHEGRQRVIFYAEPKDSNQIPKQTPDKESLGAAWLSLEELKAKKNIAPPEGLRGEELLDWGTYIESGGTIYPLDVFATELTPVPDVTL